MTKVAPIHPGEVLREEFMAPHGLSANRLARDIDVPPNRITGIINGTRAISVDTAIRLSAAFNTSPEFWMNLQTRHDLEVLNEAEGHRIRNRVRSYA